MANKGGGGSFGSGGGGGGTLHSGVNMRGSMPGAPPGKINHQPLLTHFASFNQT